MRHIAIALTLLLASASLALAAPPEGGEPPPPPGGEPQYQGEPGQQPYQGEVVETPTYEQQPAPAGEEPSGAEGRGIEYGLHVVVPIFFQEGINPGIGLQLRGGWEFGGGWTVELNLGLMGNGFTEGKTQQILEDHGLSFTPKGTSNIWIGGGVRYMFFNPSAFVPMIGAGIKVNFWSLCEETGSGFVCNEEQSTTLGVNGMAGFAYEISPFIAIEAGVQLELTGGTKAFDDGAMYLLPFAGGTLYY